MWLLFKVEALRQIRANKHALFKLDISSQRCFSKSNDLVGHTQSRGVPFAASVSNCISYNIRRIRFHLVVLAPKTVLQRCRLKNMQQPRESRALWQLSYPYHQHFPDPLLLIVNIWNSRKATVFHLRRKLHFQQQGAVFPRAIASHHWKGKEQLKLASEGQFRLAWLPLIGLAD